MASTSEFGFKELFAQIIGDIAKAVCERSGETPQQQFARSQAAVHMIMGFLPRDVVEVLLAGHCVLFHETMLAAVHDTLHGEADATRQGTRSALVAMNKEFNSNLGLLARYQARPSAGRLETSEAGPAAVRRETPGAPPATGRRDTPLADPDAVIIARTGATLSPAGPTETAAAAEVPPSVETTRPAAQPAQPAPVSAAQEELDWLMEHDPEARMEYCPSPAMLAECQANPEAVAALKAGDPARFAKALGIAIPDEAFLEAASTPGSPFDPDAKGPWPASTVPARRKG